MPMEAPKRLAPGKEIAARICADVSDAARHLQSTCGVSPQLVVIEVGDHNYGVLLEDLQDIDGPREVKECPAGLSNYAELKVTMAERCGIRSRLVRFSQNVPEEELLKFIEQLMEDSAVHGILVELPLPVHLDEQKVLAAVGAHKDVDGFSAENTGLLSMRRANPLTLPAVATGIVEILERSNVPLAGMEAVVLGRSSTVGTPVALMLQQRDCTVTVCHSRTRHIEDHVKRADIVVACVGKPGFVRGAWLKPGAVVIDVGMNSVPAQDSERCARIVGDVCYDEAKQVTSLVTPVPGGVGHVCFAVLLRNVVNLARNSLGLVKMTTGPTGSSAELAPKDRAALHASPDTLHFADLGLRVPELLLPREGVDRTKWCVIACDQYTSQPKYWKEVRDFVASEPSTLGLIFPEVYLGQGRDQQIIQGIRDKMYEYDRAGILHPAAPGLVLVDRKTPVVESRKGLLVELDLDLYSFEKGSQSLIRATEKTIEERLPPRIAIRQQASVELPHILVLIDDPERTVIEPLVQERERHALLYDFELMQGAGHLRGHHITSRSAIEGVVKGLRRLADPQHFRERYGAGKEHGVLLFAVGDGNHSLATAKRCWEELKRKGAADDHPARFALVELNNIHDPGLQFEPIHRLLFNVAPEGLLADAKAFFAAQGMAVEVHLGSSFRSNGGHEMVFRWDESSSATLVVKDPKFVLAAATLTSWLDPYLAAHKLAQVDYVHGTEVIDEKCGADPKTVGILLPAMDKNALCRTVVQEGVLPRKTFSMGEADEKRFYFEARRIVPETGFYRADFFRRGHVSGPLQKVRRLSE